jgi:hypothetical protein
MYFMQAKILLGLSSKHSPIELLFNAKIEYNAIELVFNAHEGTTVQEFMSGKRYLIYSNSNLGLILFGLDLISPP